MASKEQIKKVILDIAGNPSVGAIYNYADKWAEAIWNLDNLTHEEERQPDSDPMAAVAKRETRITKPTEKR